jgi:hypothetical protein
MRKLLVVAALALLPLASQAQFSLGARIGYAPAMGDYVKDAPMSDGVKSQIPIQLDALYSFTPAFAAGAYLSYGFAQLEGDCADCSASDLRLGIQGTYAFNSVSQQFVPWLGAGIGYEIASVDNGAGSVDTSGWELLNLQGGADYKVGEKFSVGPYVLFSIGQYSSIEGNDIAEKGTHEWLGFGVRGKFDL